jgi:hypothetical protein
MKTQIKGSLRKTLLKIILRNIIQAQIFKLKFKKTKEIFPRINRIKHPITRIFMKSLKENNNIIKDL